MRYLQRVLSLGLGLYVALLPWQTRVLLAQPRLGVELTEYGSVSLYATDVLLVLILATALFALRSRAVRSPVGFGVLALAVVCVGSALFANRADVALWSLRLVVTGGALWWLLQQPWVHRGFVLGCFLGGAVLQSLIGIGQFLAQTSPASSWLGLAAHDPGAAGTSVVETAGQRWLRAYGSTPHPNILGGYVAVALFVAFGFYLRAYERIRQGFATWTRENVRRHREGRAWYARQAWHIAGLLGVQAVLVCGLLLSFSRSAWVGFLAGWVAVLIALLVLRWPRAWQLWAKWTAFAGVVATLTILAVPQAFVARSAGEGRLEQQSLSVRQQQFDDAYDLLAREPLRGVGYGNMVVAIRDRLGTFRESVHDYQPVHNIYLLSSVELGIIGGVVFLAVCVLALQEAIRRAFSVRHWSRVTALGAFACLLVIGLFDHYLWTLAVGVSLFWFVVGWGSGE